MAMEHMKTADASTEITRVHLGPNMSLTQQMLLQSVLVLRRYAARHTDVQGIDCTHPRRNNKEVQTAAMNEWIGQMGSADVRGRYRAFIDRLSQENVDLGDVDLTDDAACAELIARIEGEQGLDAATEEETMH